MDIELRRPGEDPRIETRAEANESVDREKRYSQILECLAERGPSTAKQAAVWMCLSGLIPTSERNYTAPRLTELCRLGLVEPMGKVKDAFSHKKVTVYRLREK